MFLLPALLLHVKIVIVIAVKVVIVHRNRVIADAKENKITLFYRVFLVVISFEVHDFFILCR